MLYKYRVHIFLCSLNCCIPSSSQKAAAWGSFSLLLSQIFPFIFPRFYIFAASSPPPLSLGVMFDLVFVFQHSAFASLSPTLFSGIRILLGANPSLPLSGSLCLCIPLQLHFVFALISFYFRFQHVLLCAFRAIFCRILQLLRALLRGASFALLRSSGCAPALRYSRAPCLFVLHLARLFIAFNLRSK